MYVARSNDPRGSLRAVLGELKLVIDALSASPADAKTTPSFARSTPQSWTFGCLNAVRYSHLTRQLFSLLPLFL